MATTYKLRIDITENFGKKQAVEFVDKHSSKYIYGVENEDGDNPHMHIIMESTYKMPTLRCHLRAKGLKGNGSYSLGVYDCENYVKGVAYLLKEYNVSSKGYGKEFLEEAMEYDKKVKAEIKDKKEKNKDKRKTEIRELLESTLANKDLDYYPYEHAVKKCVGALVRYMVDHREKIYYSSIEGTVVSFLCSISSKYEDRVVNCIAGRFPGMYVDVKDILLV